jgi:hypothetical protein
MKCKPLAVGKRSATCLGQQDSSPFAPPPSGFVQESQTQPLKKATAPILLASGFQSDGLEASSHKFTYGRRRRRWEERQTETLKIRKGAVETAFGGLLKELCAGAWESKLSAA